MGGLLPLPNWLFPDIVKQELTGIGVRKLLPVAAAICALLPDFAREAHGAAQAAKLEGMSYQKAREIILQYGWKPLSGPCQGASNSSCAHFPEIGSCSGVAPGHCAMIFAHKDQCLYITTTGGDPEGEQEGDTHVVAVSFRRGPCSKN